MSAYSTINITRQKAKAVILAKILSDIEDRELGELLFRITSESSLYNYRIVDDDQENDDCLL